MTPGNEERLIQLLAGQVRSRGYVRIGIGDDACVLPGGVVMTTDAYVEGVHFDLRYMTWRDVGARCACAAVSDVIAMGADPQVVLVALGVPRSFATPAGRRKPVAIYRGIESVCSAMGCEVAGGDTVASERVFLALTVTGQTRRPILRAGAVPGDRLYVTGSVGDSEAGRRILSAGRRRGRPPGQLVQRHLRPEPRIRVMRALRASMHSLTDTSDGLATDARHLAAAGRVRIVIDADRLPVSAGVKRYCADEGLDLTDFALSAGEDHELLFTARARIPASVGGVRVSCIGSVAGGSGLHCRRRDVVTRVTSSGYDHFA
jgi:thiamine-monophosphate kinase